VSIKGVGIDIIEVERIARAYGRNKKFLSRVFTQNEINYCMNKKNKFQHLSARFAAKEAFFKALGKRIRWRDIEIINQPSGKPEIRIHDPTISFSKIHVSISHLEKYAIAIVIIE
jgi:holo-[acyl-carrier protein] synthase